MRTLTEERIAKMAKAYQRAKEVLGREPFVDEIVNFVPPEAEKEERMLNIQTTPQADILVSMVFFAMAIVAVEIWLKRRGR